MPVRSMTPERPSPQPGKGANGFASSSLSANVELDSLRATLCHWRAVDDLRFELPAQHGGYGVRLEQALRLCAQHLRAAHRTVGVDQHFELHPAIDAGTRSVARV